MVALARRSVALAAQFVMVAKRITAVVIAAVLTASLLFAQDVPPPEDETIELALITGEVLEVDVGAGVMIVHVEAVEDQEVDHFDLEVRVHEETLFENESEWTIATARDLEGTLVDIEGFMDGDAFIADIVWVVEGPIEEAPKAVA